MAVRWDRLFADLEGQLSAELAGQLAGEVEERTRGELASLRLVDRLRPHLGAPIEVVVEGAGPVRGRLARLGADFLLLDLAGQPDALVALQAVLAVRGVSVSTADPGAAGPVLSRLGLVSALRGLARDRSPVRLVRRDAAVHSGTIDRVGADFVDLAEHDVAEARRAAQVSGVLTLALPAIGMVRPA